MNGRNAPAFAVSSDDGKIVPLGEPVEVLWGAGEVRTIPARQTYTATFTAKGAAARRAIRTLFGLPYKHPRQILHNGRKPR